MNGWRLWTTRSTAKSNRNSRRNENETVSICSIDDLSADFLLCLFLAKSARQSDNFSESVEPEVTKRKINLQINGQTYSATLYDTPLADALYDMLPMMVSFEDYNRTEKIGYLPDKQPLPIEGITDGFEPSTGDLCYYAPWGNLSLFYKSFRYSDNLYSIGHVDADMSFLSEIDESFTITFDKP